MKRLVAATTCAVLAAASHAQAGDFTFTTPAPGSAATTYITAGQLLHVVDPQFGQDFYIIQSNQYISADQFASTGDLNSAIATVNSSLNGLSSSINAQGTTIASLSSSIASINGSLASLQAGLAHLKSESLSGISLAAALTPVLPADGKSNHINFATANADGFQAVSVNYARVEGSFDFVAGAAFTQRYALAKAGIGYSW